MANPMTDADLAAIDARCEKATPNWVVRDLAMPGESLLQMGDPDRHSGVPFRSIQMRTDDAMFAAASRTDVPALSQHARSETRRADAAEAEVRRLRRGVDEIVGRTTIEGDIKQDGYSLNEIARNLLAGREWNNCADGAKGWWDDEL